MTHYESKLIPSSWINIYFFNGSIYFIDFHANKPNGLYSLNTSLFNYLLYKLSYDEHEKVHRNPHDSFISSTPRKHPILYDQFK